MRTAVLCVLALLVMGASSKVAINCGPPRDFTTGGSGGGGGGGGSGGAAPPCDLEGEVTYTDIRPIFAFHCLRCHSTNLVGDDARHDSNPLVNFNTYEAATAVFFEDVTVPERALEMINPCVVDDEVCLDEGIMPFDGVTEPTLTEYECLKAWVDQGVLP